jgi:hypothetical protein
MAEADAAPDLQVLVDNQRRIVAELQKRTMRELDRQSSLDLVSRSCSSLAVGIDKLRTLEDPDA